MHRIKIPLENGVAKVALDKISLKPGDNVKRTEVIHQLYQGKSELIQLLEKFDFDY